MEELRAEGRATRAFQLMKAHVVKTASDATLSQAADLMDLYQVSGLPVVDDDGRLCGILTQYDILRAFRQSDDDVDTNAAGSMMDRWRRRAPEVGSQLVRDWMSFPVHAVLDTDPVIAAAAAMLDRGLARMPVVAADGGVVGAIDRIDVLQALFEGNLL